MNVQTGMLTDPIMEELMYQQKYKDPMEPENIEEYCDINVPPPKGWKFVRRPNAVTRDGWLPRVPKSTVRLTNVPIKNIILTYDIGTPFCKDHRACIDTIKLHQHMQMEEMNLPDIAYNFLVGGDGKIYEARGFEYLPEKNAQFPELYGNSIEIAFIGNNANEVPREDFMNLVKFLNHATYVTHDISKQHMIYESEPRFLINSAFSRR
ncbi:peptidoglycan-recognition protein 1-like [Macrosteles quadrilineatus]|nr:peptidoglycan-recognition protein 1-like [Macrosteles quadrilineatus]